MSPTAPVPPRPDETPQELRARIYSEWLVHAAGCKGACRLKGIDCHHAKRLREAYRAARDALPKDEQRPIGS
ncbi:MULTISPECIES: hypothetical protein [unclassified Streptomyces]|uniref:hypothetical protein n=1 Tax=unclassified Streptomyces TaxID=2593676 RepID=UPI0038080FF9